METLFTGKIVHFIPGGSRNILMEVVSLRSSIPVVLLSLTSPDQIMKDFCSQNKVEYFTLGSSELIGLRNFYRLWRFLIGNDIRVLFCHSFIPSIYGAFLRLTFISTRIVVVRHHNLVHTIRNFWKARLLDLMINKLAHHIVAVSNSVRDTLINEHCSPVKITIIPNGLWPPEIIDYPQPSESTRDFVKILAIGRLDWQKNYEGMLKTCWELKNQGVKFSLKILGTGGMEYTKSLFILCRSLNLQDNVEWLGRQDNIEYWFGNSHIFLHTAFDEAYPLVLIEALQNQIPVVSSNAGGCKDALRGFYRGYNPNDHEAFAREIIRICDNYDSAKKYACVIANDKSLRNSAIEMSEAYDTLAIKIISKPKIEKMGIDSDH